MKFAGLALVSSLAVAQLSVGAVSTLYSLNVPGSSGDVFDGVDGWTQSEANFSALHPRSYVSEFSDGALRVTGFSLGGYYDTEPLSSASNNITVSQGLPGNHGAAGAVLTADFQLLDSHHLNDPTNAGSGYFDTDRNLFSLGLSGLVTVVFKPIAQSASPGTNDATWHAHLSIGGSTNPTHFAVVQESGLHHLELSMTARNLTNLSYVARITDGHGSSESATGILVGANGTPLSNIAVGWGVDGSEGQRLDVLGSNSIAISALTVTIPEPSSSSLLLAGVGALLFLRRRR